MQIPHCKRLRRSSTCPCSVCKIYTAKPNTSVPRDSIDASQGLNQLTPDASNIALAVASCVLFAEGLFVAAATFVAGLDISKSVLCWLWKGRALEKFAESRLRVPRTAAARSGRG